MSKVAVLLSGGLDSTVACALANSTEDLALTISVNYSQRHVRELESANYISSYYGVPNITIDLSSWGRQLKGSALTDASINVPSGCYTDMNMSLTAVPNRNATFLMAAVGIAYSYNIDEVWVAVHSGDHNLYADCRVDFIESIMKTAELSTEYKVSIKAPFVNMDKKDIISLGVSLGAPLDRTWSCYKGGVLHCGVCGTCKERLESFRSLRFIDPVIYMEGL